MTNHRNDRRPGGGRGRQSLCTDTAARACGGPGFRRGNVGTAGLALSLLITASPALAHPGHDDPVGLLAQLVHAVLGTEAGLVLLVAGSAALLGGMARRLRRVRRAAKAPAVARRAGKS